MTKTKTMFFGVFLSLCALGISFFAGCGVTKGAWVEFQSEYHVYYTSYMYPTANAHICVYENEEHGEFETPMLTITFYPRILGPDTIDGKKTTIVDVSGRYYEMHVDIVKSSIIYSPEKSIYLNGTKLEGKIHDLDTMIFFTYEDFGLICGNSSGSISGFVNVIEYK